MILEQFYLNCLAHASYLVGDEESGAAPLLVDVRSPAEHEQKQVAGSVNVALSRLLQWTPAATNRPLLVMCAGGYRSSIAASLLQRRGINQISEVAGGLAAWESAKLPVRRGSGGPPSRGS